MRSRILHHGNAGNVEERMDVKVYLSWNVQ